MSMESAIGFINRSRSKDITYLVKVPGLRFNWTDHIHRGHGRGTSIAADVHTQTTGLSSGTRHGCFSCRLKLNRAISPIGVFWLSTKAMVSLRCDASDGNPGELVGGRQRERGRTGRSVDLTIYREKRRRPETSSALQPCL